MWGLGKASTPPSSADLWALLTQLPDDGHRPEEPGRGAPPAGAAEQGGGLRQH